MGTLGFGRARSAIAAAISGALLVAVIATAVVISGHRNPPEAPIPAAPKPTPSVSPSPEAADGYPANTTEYQLAAFPMVDVFAVNAALLVDDRPGEAVLPLVATPRVPGAPVFADPTGEPVGQLPSTLRFDGTTVPVIEQEEHWVRVLLSGRAGLPSQGVTGQLTGWLRTSDVVLADHATSVRVDLAASTIAILEAGEVVYQTTGFGWGAAATPTPIGRTFIMTTRVDPKAGYTQGHPLVYLGVQSSVLDGFDGQNNAVTAFHYHDAHAGSISNGCLRVDAAAIGWLASLPLGTPVVITG